MTKTRKSPSRKKKLPTKKAGRHSKFKDEYIHMAYVACKESGFTILKLAKLFNVSQTTIKTWKTEHSAFLAAIKTGKDKWDSLSAEKSMLKRVMGFRYTETTREPDESGVMVIVKKVSKLVPPDVKACDIWLCNRNSKRWKKLKHVELTGKDGSALFANLSDKELDERIATKLTESK